MKRRQLTFLIAAAALIFALAAIIAAWRNGLISSKPEALLLRLPTQDAVVVGADFAALRHGSYLKMLAGSKQSREPEYIEFVRDTGFDYERDLDAALISFAPDGTFFLITGKFDWNRLTSYVRAHNGNCDEGLCRLKGSTPQRKISFFELKRNVMAMAVSTDDRAALRLKQAGPQQDIDVPAAPVWLTLSAGAIRHSTLTGNTKLLASSLSNADRVTLTLRPADSRLEAHLEAVCGDPEQAGALATQLKLLTAVLREAALRASRGGTKDELTSVLTGGSFEQAGSRVTGQWSIPPSLLTNLTAGL